MQIETYFLNNNLCSDSQFGFRKNRSTNDALLTFQNEIITRVNKNEKVALVTIDYSKAFDCIDHSLMVQILRSYGFQSDSLNLISSYLSDRNNTFFATIIKLH